ncbi:MAG TPA: photosystem reaction center subunit H [Citreicella sp.]|nr:photosystem reaction center subunit H [Citreicella sp.]
MLISLTDLLSWRVRAGERRLALHDLLFEAETRRLVYVMVEPAGLAPGDRVLIAASALGVPEAEAQEMPLHLREDELDRAPRCGGGHDEMVAMLAAMPPMAIGPFGAPSAPLLMPEHERPGEDEPDPRAQAALARYDRLGDWLGHPVFARDGEAGTVSDLLYDPVAGELTHIVVDNGKLFGHRQRAVPMFELVTRAEAERGGHVVLDLTLAGLETAPLASDMLSPE